MPLPQPSPGQTEEEFISACMADDTMVSEYPDEAQRMAVCESQWIKHERENDIMSKNQWFKITNLAGESGNKDNPRRAEIAIMEQIGEDWWTGQGITAGPFMRAIDALGELDEILLRINSPGGDVMDGLTIANYLFQHPARVTVRVEGQAASIASVIMMAGDERIMGLGTSVFVHDPITGVIGDADDMRKIADELDKIRDGIIDVYQSRVNLSREELITLMKDDTRMTADEAIAWGFATGKDSELKAAACADLAKTFAAAKAQAQAKLEAIKEADSVRVERDHLKAKVDELTARIEALRKDSDPADPATVIAECAKAGIANLAADWIQEKASMSMIQSRIAFAHAMRDICAAADEDPTPYLAKADDAGEVFRILMVNLKAARDRHIDNTLQPGVDGGGKTGKSFAEIYRRRNMNKLLMR